jgi:flagellar hook-length control protein FliK
MSIPAISSLIVAVGGKTALPSLGEILPEGGLPLDFAALLAGQIPPSGQTAPALLATETIPAGQQPATELLSGIINQASANKVNITPPVDEEQSTTSPVIAGSAEGILAALSAGTGKPATAIGEPDSKKESSDKDPKAAAESDPIPADPSLATQYVIPQITPPVQNRVPDSVDRSMSGAPAQSPKANSTGISAKANSTGISAKEGRSGLPEQAHPVAPGATSAPLPSAPLATQTTESRIVPRSDTANTANTAILAGDSNAGNSGNTPAFATVLAATGAANAAATSAPPAQPPAVTSALNSPNWTQDFGTHVIWLAKNEQQVAQININPPQLGPVQISISLNGDQVSATFTSPHPEVRQAIHDSLPQLREMFTAAGISLGQANVGSQLPSQNREAPYQFANEARSSGENAILSPDSHSSSNTAGIPVQRGRGLVDLFA